MGWFFSDDDGDDDGFFSGSFSLGDIFGSLFGEGLFGSLFGKPEEIAEPDPYAHLPKKERDFFEKIKIVIGDDPEALNPESVFYEAHKMKLFFELEDDLLFDGLSEYELGVKHYERECYCHTHKLCPRCYERLENGVCLYCE